MSAAKARLNELARAAHAQHERFTLTRHGTPEAVLLSVDDLEGLETTLEMLSVAGSVATFRRVAGRAPQRRPPPSTSLTSGSRYDNLPRPPAGRPRDVDRVIPAPGTRRRSRRAHRRKFATVASSSSQLVLRTPSTATPTTWPGRSIRCSQAGIDAVADVAGGPLIAQLMPLIRDDGRWVIAGAVAGPVVDFDLRRLYLHNISLIGSSMHTRDHFATLVDAARAGAAQPVIAARHPLNDLATAHHQFRRGQHVGKIIIAIE